MFHNGWFLIWPCKVRWNRRGLSTAEVGNVVRLLAGLFEEQQPAAGENHEAAEELLERLRGQRLRQRRSHETSDDGQRHQRRGHPPVDVAELMMLERARQCGGN